MSPEERYSVDIDQSFFQIFRRCIVLSALLTSLGSVATEVLSLVGDVCTTIVAQPVLLLTMGILLLGGSIGIFGRLLSRN